MNWNDQLMCVQNGRRRKARAKHTLCREAVELHLGPRCLGAGFECDDRYPFGPPAGVVL